MGLGDKFKDLAKQAQGAVAEHKEQIHEAVDAVSVAADQKTRGKYTAKIAKINEKAGGAVERFAAGEAGAAGTTGAGAADDDPDGEAGTGQ